MTLATMSSEGITAVDEPTIDVTVTAMERAAPDILILTLQSVSGDPLPDWTEGAHIDLVLPNGMVRQYSLCGDVDDVRTYRVGVLREITGRGGSSYVHDQLGVGERLGLRGPRNHFQLLPSPRYVFIAGGIGATPLVPMAAAAHRAGAAFDFIYCARNREAMAFLDELRDRYEHNLTVNADDESGLFDLQSFFHDARSDTLVYACGPTPFLDATVRATKDWPHGSIHFERFEPIEFDETTNTEFTVELASSGKVLDVPADKSLLSVLTDNGVRVLSSCSEGTCGTCEVAVLGGDKIEHRDAVLSEDEQESGEMMMVCVSRCQGGRLLLDL